MLNVQIKRAGYKENIPVLNNVNFSIEKGEIVGLLGPNGAGKSTIIKGLLGVLPYCEGQVELLNKHLYAYIPEHPIFYDDLTVCEHIDFVGVSKAIPSEELTRRSEKLLHMFELSDVKHHYPSTFSKGMKQKLMIILAFLLEPELYIIDEPFMGLDAKAMKRFIDYLYKEKDRQAGILLCTHSLDTAERICDRFLLLSSGELIAEGTLSSIQKQANIGVTGLYECFFELIDG
ncbi:ABC transporter ATP-binding protein [Bacillus sp. HMF5848]|uniref:ABC transporter ATP-binding protein n=1 Tax=Bacillus sp. HMF5848 TaxID=2495421 RepID=UPI000F7A2887|nr:ABC transporter ATP-binding protein [Bacillus sp. HMF5848]RSK29250.1 ABC transporter ATP-binding protein [Bacillus sp. HMF5848]